MPRPRMKPVPRSRQLSVGGVEISKRGASQYDFRDPYHLAVTASWPAFFLGLFVVELAVNLAFAGLYSLQPGAIDHARSGSLIDLFFFSIETLATVGYGVMAPATLYGHVVSAVEIFCGLIFTALVTGLIFVRFSRPRSKILFADCAVVTPYNGVPSLMIRVANGRMSLLVEATAKLDVLLRETSAEGQVFRHPYELTLVRCRLATFALTWTLIHVIDETSPLRGMNDAAMLRRAEARLILSVEARDIALGVPSQNMRGYGVDEIRFGMRYDDATTTAEDGTVHTDLTRLSLMLSDSS